MEKISEEEFKLLVKGTIVVQFGATWCSPCRVLSSVINDNEESFNNPFYKMDIDECQSLTAALGIRSVPTIIRFENQKEVRRAIGNQSLENLIDLAL